MHEWYAHESLHPGCMMIVYLPMHSRATACVLGLTRPLTVDHNTSNAKERERVGAMGGTIKDNR